MDGCYCIKVAEGKEQTLYTNPPLRRGENLAKWWPIPPRLLHRPHTCIEGDSPEVAVESSYLRRQDLHTFGGGTLGASPCGGPPLGASAMSSDLVRGIAFLSYFRHLYSFMYVYIYVMYVDIYVNLIIYVKYTYMLINMFRKPSPI